MATPKHPSDIKPFSTSAGIYEGEGGAQPAMYEIRRTRASEPYGWAIHEIGLHNAVVGYALTRWGATRRARRWTKRNQRSKQSYTVA